MKVFVYNITWPANGKNDDRWSLAPGSITVDAPDKCDDLELFIDTWIRAYYGAEGCSYMFDAEDGREKKDPKRVFKICIRRSDVIWWNVLAYGLDDAKRIVRERAATNDWWAGWDWEGDEVGIQDDGSYCAPNEDWDFTDPEYPEAHERSGGFKVEE